MGKRCHWIRPKELRRSKHFEVWKDESFGLLFSGDTNVCPHCGGSAYLPIGCISSNSDPSILNRYNNTCKLIDCVDEGRSTVGYYVACKYGLTDYAWLKQQTGGIYEG